MKLTQVILIVSLIPFLKAQKLLNKNHISKEQVVSDESKQTLNEGIRENLRQNNVNEINDDITSTQVLELRNENNSLNKLLSKKDNDRNILAKDKQRNSILNKQKKLSKNITISTTNFNKGVQNKSKIFDNNSESDQDEQSSEHSSEDTDIVDDRPSLDENAASKINKNLPQITEKINLKLYNSNTDLIDTRPVKDDQKSFKHSNNDIIDTRPITDEDKVTKNQANVKQSPNKHKKHNSNMNKIIKTDSKLERKSKANVSIPDKVIHSKHSMVSDHDFPYMAAVIKGGKYVCAGALVDEKWVLTAANNLMRESIRLLRIRLGSVNFKKGGILLPIKYFEIHPYFNSSIPEYDLALLMLSKPVRYTVSIRSIRLQLTPKDVTATHFIMTAWQAAVRARNQSTVEVIKHSRMLSVTHLHPTNPEDCLEELREFGAASDGVMCLESEADNTCVRDTGAPIVINGVLWGIISSWRPEECDDEVSTFATLVSGRNISTWLHATVHGHTWHPE